MLDIFTHCIVAEIGRLQGAADWRSFVLRKRIHQVSSERQPVPDGLSRSYLALAGACNEDDDIERCRIRGRESPLLTMVESLVSRELEQALIHEHDLLTLNVAAA